MEEREEVVFSYRVGFYDTFYLYLNRHRRGKAPFAVCYEEGNFLRDGVVGGGWMGWDGNSVADYVLTSEQGRERKKEEIH